MLTTFHRKIAMEAALLIGIAKIKYAKRLGVAFRSGAALLTCPTGQAHCPNYLWIHCSDCAKKSVERGRRSFENLVMSYSPDTAKTDRRAVFLENVAVR